MRFERAIFAVLLAWAAAGCTGIHAAEKAEKLVILKAEYGNFDLPDGIKIDVTEKVKALVDKDGLSVVANNQNFGDPVEGVVKKLTVTYTLGGQKLEMTAEEGATLTIEARPGAKPGTKQVAKGKSIHEKMDYGPFLGGSIESNYPVNGNFALKGLAIRLGDKQQASVTFDTEMLRYSVGWTGEWLKLDYGRDGLASHPTLRGTPEFGTKGTSLGWAHEGKWDDPRAKATTGRPEGPLPAAWAKYKGVYLDGRKVVLHYTVGDCDVLEQPNFDDSDNLHVFSRTLQLGKSATPLTMLLIEDDKAEASSAASGTFAQLDLGELALVCGMAGAPAGTEFVLEQKRIVVKFPALAAPAMLTIKIARVKKSEVDAFKKLVNSNLPNVNFAVTTKGGAPRWQPIETQGELAKSDAGGYVVDNITVPYENPYNAYMRLTGVDFFKDGRAAVCTMSGDVWIVSGIDDTLGKLVWRRYATGLFATLGLKIVDDVVYTLGRDQITRFYDLNGDGEADYYENFNNDCTVGPDYHEFAHDLHTDSKGDFYYMKGSNLSTGGGIYHGTMVKVSKDGSKSEIYCEGFRAPNGMCVGPDDVITTGDNQGNWTPSSPINYIKKGGFYGFQLDNYPESKKGPRENPLCWVPYDEDNSCGGQVWSGSQWGPLSNRLLHLSYGKCKLFSTIIEKYQDQVQGGVVKFPLNFVSGIMRGRVNPHDGQVYLAGMRGWQTSGARDGVLSRVRYTGKPYTAPVAVTTSNTALTIVFSDPLDKETVEDASSWDVRRFNIKYSGAYGSDEYSVDEPDKKPHRCGDKAARDVVPVTSVKLGDDGKTVTLTVASMKLCTNMVVSYKIKTKDGAKLSQDLDYTINFIPGGDRSPGMFPPEPKKKVK